MAGLVARLAGDPVTIAVHIGSVARFAGIKRRLAEQSYLVAPGIIHACFDCRALLRALFEGSRNGRQRRPQDAARRTAYAGEAKDEGVLHLALMQAFGFKAVKSAGAFQIATRLYEPTDRYDRTLAVVKRTKPDGSEGRMADWMQTLGGARGYDG